MAPCEHMSKRDRYSNHIAYYNFSKSSLCPKEYAWLKIAFSFWMELYTDIVACWELLLYINDLKIAFIKLKTENFMKFLSNLWN